MSSASTAKRKAEDGAHRSESPTKRAKTADPEPEPEVQSPLAMPDMKSLRIVPFPEKVIFPHHTSPQVVLYLEKNSYADLLS